MAIIRVTVSDEELEQISSMMKAQPEIKTKADYFRLAHHALYGFSIKRKALTPEMWSGEFRQGRPVKKETTLTS